MRPIEISPASLDVFLNGARSYVQGTQMIARSAEHLASLGPSDAPLPELQTAVFHRISDRGVTIREGQAVSPKDAPDDLLGALVFAHGDARIGLHLVEAQDTAPRRDAPHAGRWSEQTAARQGALSTAFDVEGLKTGEDLLVAIVQTVKGLHEALAADVHDVWLTGFRSANVPLAGPLPSTSGVLSLQSRRVMKGPDVWQTLQMASFAPTDATMPEVRAAVTFSFKSQELTHVD